MYSLKLLTLAIAFSPFFCISKSLTQSENNFTFSFTEGNRVELDSALELRYVDNYLNQKSDEQGTSSQKVSASTYIQFHNDTHLFQGKLNAGYLWFEQFDEDDHDEIDAKLKYFYKINNFHRVFFSGSMKNTFEYRGTGSSKGNQLIADKGQEFDDTLLNLGYLFGRSDSVSKFSFLAGSNEREYESNQRNNGRLNYNTNFVEVSLDYLISGKTYMSLLTSYKEIDFSIAKEQNRNETSVLAGIKWEPSDLSNLEALFGYQQLNFDDGTIDNSSQFKWLISYDWRPLNYFGVKFDSGRTTESSVDIRTNYAIKDSFRLYVQYDVNSFTSLAINTSYAEEETNFVGQSLTEQVLTTGVDLNYNVNSRIRLFTGIISNNVNSEVSINEYDSLLFTLGINGDFD